MFTGERCNIGWNKKTIWRYKTTEGNTGTYNVYQTALWILVADLNTWMIKISIEFHPKNILLIWIRHHLITSKGLHNFDLRFAFTTLKKEGSFLVSQLLWYKASDFKKKINPNDFPISLLVPILSLLTKDKNWEKKLRCSLADHYWRQIWQTNVLQCLYIGTWFLI